MFWEYNKIELIYGFLFSWTVSTFWCCILSWTVAITTWCIEKCTAFWPPYNYMTTDSSSSWKYGHRMRHSDINVQVL